MYISGAFDLPDETQSLNLAPYGTPDEMTIFHNVDSVSIANSSSSKKRKRHLPEPLDLEKNIYTSYSPGNLHHLSAPFNYGNEIIPQYRSEEPLPNTHLRPIAQPSSMVKRVCRKLQDAPTSTHSSPHLRPTMPRSTSSPAHLSIFKQALTPSPGISPKTIPEQLPAAPTSVPLKACHICHRKPATKALLDAYADCELCRNRSCFVCLRECTRTGCKPPTDTADDYGHHGVPGRKVCSFCAVEGLDEQGQEVVRCLDCVGTGEKQGESPWGFRSRGR